MKRKIFSVLLALVLVLSFSLVTAVPAGAAEAEYTLITGGVGVAEWSADESYTGSYSLKLFAPAATGDYGKVVMPLEMEFEDLADFSVWVEGGTTAAQALPLHDIKAVVDDVAGVTLPASNKGTGEGVDLQNKIVVLASQPGQSEDLSATLMSDGIAGWEKYGTHSGADIDVGTGDYWSMFVYSDARVWEATYDYYTWDEIHTALDGKATVTEVRIELRYPQDPADVASTVYVDDIVINETTYDLEQPAAVWVATTGDDANPGTEASPFLTIQYAIDILADGIVNVAAGTYDENVVVDKALTLQGATGATVAPTVGIGVEIQASNVTVDGFTITPLGTVVDAAQGITITADGTSGITISSNNITTVGVGGHGIYTPMSSTGLTVTGNTITVSAVATAFYADGGPSLSAKNSGWTISGNTLEASDATGGVNLELYDVDAVTVDNNTFKAVRNSNIIVSAEVYDLTGPIVFTNNDVQGNTGGSMVAFITDFRDVPDDTTMADVTITGNTFNGWATRGLRIGKDVTGVTVNQNLFMKTGASVYALQWENDAAVVLDAQYNWWGGVAGPVHAKNPYNTQAGTQQNGEAVESSTGTIDFTPWMIHTELVSGWNIYSTPIAPGVASNTIAKALDLWTTDTGSYTIGWYF